MFVNNFFCLSPTYLLNELKTKVKALLIYKQTNMNELFIELNPSYSWSAWFIYSPRKKGHWSIGSIVCLSEMLLQFRQVGNLIQSIQNQLTYIKLITPTTMWRNATFFFFLIWLIISLQSCLARASSKLLHFS